MKCFLFFLTFNLAVSLTHGQTALDSVKAAVNDLFTAMKSSNGAMLKKCFADSAILQTISRNKEGNLVVTTEPINDFADFINKEEKGNADEQIVFDVVKIDGPLAIAWTPYKFFYKGKFSHCGVNSFQLVKQNGEWKIQYIIDTRRRTGCD